MYFFLFGFIKIVEEWTMDLRSVHQNYMRNFVKTIMVTLYLSSEILRRHLNLKNFSRWFWCISSIENYTLNSTVLTTASPKGSKTKLQRRGNQEIISVRKHHLGSKAKNQIVKPRYSYFKGNCNCHSNSKKYLQNHSAIS